ncbi:MAG: hypothetical protein JSS60_04845 [Verrucomicrobia bacterium]|nr:hypothetical protein [Verrucomicrobiota bacterium]
MNKKYLKSSVRLLAVVLFAVLAKQFCYKKTDGFALYKILSDLSFNQEWECPPLSQADSEQLEKILSQPFHYLAKGAQSYVFASEDGETVIKFFRVYHMRPPLWMTALSLPLPLQPYRICKMIEKRVELGKDFQSYTIAFQQMKEETGLLYLHLNKTSHLKKHLTIYDKIGIAHDLDLDKMEFLVQKKATLVYPSIERLMKSEGEAAAREAIGALVHLLVNRCEKGIFDKDPDLNTNFGFLDKRPIQIDIGRFRLDPERNNPDVYRNEIIRITDNFRQWLESNYPPLSEHLLSEIGNIADQSL